VGPRNHALDAGPDPPREGGNFEREGRQFVKCIGNTVDVQQQCSLVSNYLDHLVYFVTVDKVLFKFSLNLFCDLFCFIDAVGWVAGSASGL